MDRGRRERDVRDGAAARGGFFGRHGGNPNFRPGPAASGADVGGQVGGYGSGYGYEEEDAYYEGNKFYSSDTFHAGGRGFAPGHGGFGPTGRHGRGRQHHGYHSRHNARNFVQRGGFVGRPGRGTTHNSNEHYSAVNTQSGVFVARNTSGVAPQQAQTIDGKAGPAAGSGQDPVQSQEQSADPVSTNNEGRASMEVDNDSGGIAAASSDARAGMKCSRCTQKGHVAAGCGVEIYCVICDSHDHVNHRCPVLKQPRPVAHAVGYAVHGLGFYHIPHPPLPKAKKDSKMALVTVVGGQLTKEQIVTQLQRVVPGKWKWDLKDNEDMSYITQFPSKSELQRSIAFGGADVVEEGVPTGIRLQFKQWFEKEEGYLLPKVWIRVFGIRKKLREFLNLWAVGSMLGSTQTVDMEMTRKNDFGRIFVAVLNPKLIPSQLDVVIGDHYFELKFQVERVGIDENGDEVEMDLDNNEDDGNNGDDDDDLIHKEMDPSLDRDPKRIKSTNMAIDGKDIPSSSNNVGTKSAFFAAAQNMNEAEFEAFLRLKAKEILDSSVGKVLEELADKVMREEGEFLDNGSYANSEKMADNVAIFGREEEVVTVNVSLDKDDLMTGDICIGVDNSGGIEVAADLPDGLGSEGLSGAGLSQSVEQDTPMLGVDGVVCKDILPSQQGLSLAEEVKTKVQAAAAIPEALVSPTRASPRLALSSDEHTLARAERRIALKNLECSEGYFQGDVLDPKLVAAI